MTAPREAFDADALRRRYRAERDRRLRPDGNDQYIEIAGRYSRFLEDPYSEPVRRDPVRDEVQVLVVGGGLAGLLAGTRLRQAGVDGIRIVEKGGGFGGTWYWNRYPGVQCDVESYVYMPLLEETGHVPSEKYAHGPEILEHCRRIAESFGLDKDALLGTVVTGLDWEPETARWLVRTDRGDEIRARFVVLGNGPLHRPKLPAVPGIDTFAGRAFHTSRWDYAYTGADLGRLAGRRVGVIGTGATAVQVVPRVAEAAGELYVFQRTPSSVDVRGNRPTDPDWAASLLPGWQRGRIDNFSQLTTGGFAAEDLVMDGWTDILGRLSSRLAGTELGRITPETLAQALELADFEKMESIRARVDAVVADPATAEALKPWYRQLCKRPCFHDEYLQAFNLPNVHLVDTGGRGVDRITPTGAVVGGEEYPLDCLVFATGFEVGTSFRRRAGYDPRGRDGVALSEHWADGMRSLHGMHVHGFPNLAILGHSQGAFTPNYAHLLDEAARHMAHVVSHAVHAGHTEVEVTAAAEQEWLDTMAATGMNMRAFQEQCTPGYFNNEGHPGAGSFVGDSYGKGPMPFFALLAEWRDAGDFAGMTFRS